MCVNVTKFSSAVPRRSSYLPAFMFLGGVHARGGTASSIFHGSIQLDAGGRFAALEQSGCSQSK